MKAAILCNGINWTINIKHYSQHVENKKLLLLLFVRRCRR